MIVAMRHADTRKCAATIVRSIETGVEDIDFVGVLRICIDARVVPGALPQIALLVRLRPVLTAVIRSKHATVFCFDNRPQTIRVRG